jgi:hypothetical protein
MGKKYLCPKCNGSGYLLKHLDDVDRHIRRIPGPYKIRCSFCNGKGWVATGPFDKLQQTSGGNAGDLIKSAVFCGTVGLVLLGPPGLIIGGVVGGLLGKASGR